MLPGAGGVRIIAEAGFEFEVGDHLRRGGCGVRLVGTDGRENADGADGREGLGDIAEGAAGRHGGLLGIEVAHWVRRADMVAPQAAAECRPEAARRVGRAARGA